MPLDPFVLCSSSLGNPLECKLFSRVSTFREIEIDEILVGNSGFSSQCLEVTDSICIEAQGYRLFKVLGIRVPNRIGEVIFFSHSNFPYCLRSFRVALRAEISRISFSFCRYA